MGRKRERKQKEGKPKILGLPGDDGACAHYRIEWPLSAIEQAGLADIYIPPQIGDERLVRFDSQGNKDPNDVTLVNNYDMIVLQRQPSSDVNMLMRLCKEQGIKVVFDIDDSALSITPDNPNYMAWGRDKRMIQQMVKSYADAGVTLPKSVRGMSPEQVAEFAQATRKGLFKNLEDAHLVTTTTETLREDYSRFNRNIEVLPNQIVAADWEKAKLEEMPSHGEIHIGWAGGWTHTRDLKLIVPTMQTIVGLFPLVRLVLIGFEQAKPLIFASLPQDKIITYPWSKDQYTYRKYVNSVDIILAPSYSSRFNSCKSDIRCLEAWMCKKPVVGSPTTYKNAIEESGGGFVAGKSKDWITALKRLIKHPMQRMMMGEAGYKYVKEKRTYRSNVSLWFDAYEELL